MGMVDRNFVRIAGVSTVTPTYPNTVIDLPDMATDSTAVVARDERTFKQSIAHAAYEEAGIGPDELSLAEVYDLSTALELDWYEDIGLCKQGEAERPQTPVHGIERAPQDVPSPEDEVQDDQQLHDATLHRRASRLVVT